MSLCASSKNLRREVQYMAAQQLFSYIDAFVLRLTINRTCSTLVYIIIVVVTVYCLLLPFSPLITIFTPLYATQHLLWPRLFTYFEYLIIIYDFEFSLRDVCVCEMFECTK